MHRPTCHAHMYAFFWQLVMVSIVTLYDNIRFTDIFGWVNELLNSDNYIYVS